MAQKLVVPKFENESEEARWWFENQDAVDDEFDLAEREGRLGRGTTMRRAQAAAAALQYRKPVLNALQEVEDGLSSLHQDALRTNALQESVAADQKALDVDVDAYRHGLITYISVLTVQTQTVQSQQQLAQAVLAQSTDMVKLFKALGGGWEKSAAAAMP